MFNTTKTVALIVSLLTIFGQIKADESNREYVAKISDFANYKGWEVIDYIIGKTNPFIGSAHKGNDINYSRIVYKSPSTEKVNGVYKVGSIVLKETFTWKDGEKKFASMGGILAMVKRGDNFNKEGGDWEWFEISPDLSKVKARGGKEMMKGMCNSCHSMANSQERGGDFVFAHPTEFKAKDSDFANYTKWTMIGDTSGPSPFLGKAHKGRDPKARRRVYKKQILAKPLKGWGYPIGTMILKEIVENGKVVEITAMVKRGGEFNKKNNGWEWFMLDPKTHKIKARGANLMNGMCGSCHSNALNNKWGIDFVFKHPKDPFNR